MVRLVEIIRRVKQGVLEPFLCRGEDGFLYYVKGYSAGKKSLVSEWIAGNVAHEFQLPTPPCHIAYVPELLVRSSNIEDIDCLGAGFVFASQEVRDCAELRWTSVEHISHSLRKRILVFDCWVSNGDRQLGERGGNPNLLWNSVKKQLHVIDHNCAFGAELPSEIIANHIFQSEIDSFDDEFIEQASNEMKSTLERIWPKVWDQLPDEWTDELIGLTRDEVELVLTRFLNEPNVFWPNR